MMKSNEAPPTTRTVFTEAYTQKRGICVTVVILGIIIGIFALAYIIFGIEPTTVNRPVNNTLKLVNIIVHHGQTIPKFSYPTDPHVNDSTWQSSLGELTKKGKQNMYSLGKSIRERYEIFLPDLYFPVDVEVLSSNVDTCLMSAAVFLAGLYPPHKYQIWNQHIYWQPIPVKGISAEVDKMLDITKKCPRRDKLVQDIDRGALELDSSLKKVYDYLSDHTGMEVRNLETIMQLYNLFVEQEKNNLPLPKWAASVYPHQMFKFAVKSLELTTEYSLITKMSVGELLKKITNDMLKKKRNESLTKFVMYSVQERPIYNLMRVLDGDAFRKAPMKLEVSSAMILELHKINNKDIVQAFYIEQAGKQPTPLVIIDCGFRCLFEDFLNLTKTMMVNDWDEECEKVSDY